MITPKLVVLVGKTTSSEIMSRVGEEVLVEVTGMVKGGITERSKARVGSGDTSSVRGGRVGTGRAGEENMGERMIEKEEILRHRGSDCDVPSGVPVGVALRRQTYAVCSGTVAVGDGA